MKQFKVLLAAVVCLLFMYSCQDEDPLSDNSKEIIASPLHRNCTMHDHMESLMKDPSYKKAHEAKFTRLSSSQIANRSTCDNPPVIPVAVHFQGVSADAACLVALAQSQIKILNDDFKGTNSDITEWTGNASSSFPGINNSETCLTFCLADKNHPSGFGLVEGQPAVTINQTTGDTNSDFSGYLNIFVQTGTGVLGYSPLGGSGNGDGVVIEATAFGAGAGCGSVSPQSPFNLGRTTTHEVGHYLLLDHIWGGGCGQDDSVADTPDSADSYFDCPTIGESSCGSTDLHMNYMDYTNDACMYMFTEGQGDRSENYVASSLTILTNNAVNVCSDASGGGNGGGGNGGGTNDDCGEVNDLSAVVLSDTEVELSWTGFADAILYKVRYKLVSSSSFTNFTTTNTEATLSSLQANEDYVVQIRTECESGLTPWRSEVYFTTGNNNGGGGGNGGTDPVDSSCNAPAINYDTGAPLTNQACYDEVIANDSYCCGVEFDYLCQEAYDECLDSEVPGEDPSGCITAIDLYTGQVLNDACADEVQEYDNYCCDIEWDGICQWYYDECVYNGYNMNVVDQNENALITMGQNASTGTTLVTYSLKNWTPNTKVELFDGATKVKSITVVKRRGTIEVNLGNVSTTGLKSKLMVDNQIVIESANIK